MTQPDYQQWAALGAILVTVASGFLWIAKRYFVTHPYLRKSVDDLKALVESSNNRLARLENADLRRDDKLESLSRAVETLVKSVENVSRDLQGLDKRLAVKEALDSLRERRRDDKTN